VRIRNGDYRGREKEKHHPQGDFADGKKTRRKKKIQCSKPIKEKETQERGKHIQRIWGNLYKGENAKHQKKLLEPQLIEEVKFKDPIIKG